MMRSNSLIDEVSQDLSQMNIGSYWNTDVANSTDILHRQSINSLLSGGNAGHVSPQEGDTLNVTELFGLNKPRSTTLSSSCGGSEANVVGSPPKERFYTEKLSASIRTTPQSGWVDNSFSSPSTPPRYGRSDSYQSNNERSTHSWRYNNRAYNRRSSYCDSLGSAAASPGTPMGLYGSPNSPLDAAFGRNLLDLLLQEQNLFKSPRNTYIAEYTALDRAAKFHRSGANLYDATWTWSGVLPKRTGRITGYSPKVFLGGVPWDITEEMLVTAFRHIGPIKVEWPGKEKQAIQPKGFVYVVFESEKQVRHLLSLCNTAEDECLYYKISSRRMKSKQVQVIPWILNDTNYSRSPSQKLDGSKTIFVGALHGLLNAEGLAKIMNDLFEGVVYAGLDTDKHKYPIGSGRVAFSNHRSYMKAITAAFVDVKTAKFSKKVQLDPYIEDSLCSLCGVQQGPYFCRELVCFRYFCRNCWQINHMNMGSHKPLMRNSKSPILGMSYAGSP